MTLGWKHPNYSKYILSKTKANLIWTNESDWHLTVSEIIFCIWLHITRGFDGMGIFWDSWAVNSYLKFMTVCYSDDISLTQPPQVLNLIGREGIWLIFIWIIPPFSIVWLNKNILLNAVTSQVVGCFTGNWVLIDFFCSNLQNMGTLTARVTNQFWTFGWRFSNTFSII